MSKFISVSPLPPGTTAQQVKEAFRTYTLDRYAVSGNTGYLQFNDVNDLETLDFTYGDYKVDELGGAEIKPLDSNFQWPENVEPHKEEVAATTETHSEQPQSSEIKQEEVMEEKKTSGAFVMDHQPKKQEQGGTFVQPEAKPMFMVIKSCDKQLVANMSIDEIRNKIFRGFKIGRIIKWDQDVFVEFEDSLEIQKIDTMYSEMKIPAFGHNAQIDAVDPNFDIALVEKQVREHDKKIEAQKAELERKRVEKEMEAKRFTEAFTGKKEEVLKPTEETRPISVKPDYPRPMRQSSGEEVSLTKFWGIVVVTWALYVVFL